MVPGSNRGRCEVNCWMQNIIKHENF
jgi:hypothetical protein